MSELFNLPRLSAAKIVSYALVFIASLLIFFISQVIQFYLGAYNLSTMYISFCAGFILFIPLVSLVLHPLLLNKAGKSETFHFSALLANIGLVCVVQFLCFLIWMTDAVALYSLYVDQHSFLAKVFDIQTKTKGDMTFEFYCFNFILAWLFALLSLIVGVLPCLIARLDNYGVVGDFVASFSFGKKHKVLLCFYALLIASSVLLPLLYGKYLFLVLFPSVLVWVFSRLNQKYLLSSIA
ncbi:hypothetical protein [Colwellia sp. 12G3]|uniref:hypothetical protein n=1 Tax=Colwellia sp. 12G3 TaxID=2058299 RepID=UPI000C3477AD|nr:hypothetical protein [Colwellia sp. 12G3]PKI17519.1 hypothetical protein CXF71_03715 [Colwellia sp. 12G3]